MNVLILAERDKRQTYHHGVLRIPEHRSFETARAEVAQIMRRVMQRDEDDWCYETILQELAQEGYEILEHALLFEEDVDAIAADRAPQP